MRSIFRLTSLAICSFLIISQLPLHGAPDESGWKVIRAEQAATSLLQNGGFEDRDTGWKMRSAEASLDAGGGRNGGAALVCQVTQENIDSGAGQSLRLNQSIALPIIISGWSRAEGVDGRANSEYSIYVDLAFQDGTSLWGQTAEFSTGTHDWEKSEAVILPQRPVKALGVYCLFRNHRGKVWFDDVHVSEIGSDRAMALFDGQPVSAPEASASLPVKAGIKVADLAESARFLVRDVAVESDFLPLAKGKETLDLRIEEKSELKDGVLFIEGSVTSTQARDRAISLIYTLPLDATGGQWGDDIHRRREIGDTGDFSQTLQVGCGATGGMSVYPLGAIWKDSQGVALGIDMGRPTIYRVGYHAGLKSLYLALDYGLSPETTRFPNRADFRIVLYPFEAREGFRSAFARYQKAFPEYFVVRAKKQGLWMPFTDVSTVKGWEDFGFRFHEGDNNVPWDDEHDVLSFRYTEPMTWWMRMAKEMPRTPEAALAEMNRLAEADKDSTLRQKARVTRIAAMHDESGQPSLLFQNAPWTDGAVWSVNPNQWLGQGKDDKFGTLNGGTIHWNPEIRERLYGPGAKGKRDGEYLDSLEGYVTADLNYRREHFADTTVPLSYSPRTRQLALAKGLAVYEFTRWISEDLHSFDKLLFANAVPHRFTFLCPWLDVLGTETNWMRKGKYDPPGFDRMDLWRTMSGAKPYLLLMNTDYDQFGSEAVEKYFHRSLYYGIWPGFFSHNASENPYWKNPKWYERDRPLFRRFIPLIRKVSEAGWRAETGATSENPNFLIEHFGTSADGDSFLTVYNSGETKADGMVRLTEKKAKTHEWKIALDSEETAVIDLKTGDVLRP